MWRDWNKDFLIKALVVLILLILFLLIPYYVLGG
jgi:PDZ domain-containing secreted protein